MKLILNDSQLKQLADTSSNCGILLFGSLVIPVISGADKIDLNKMILGLVGGLSFIIISLLILKGVKK